MPDKERIYGSMLFASISLASASILLTAIDRSIGSVLLAAFAAIALLLYRRSGKGRGKLDSDVLQFISNLSINSRYQKSAIASLRNSLDPKFVFYKGFSHAIDAYRYSGSVDEIGMVASRYGNETLAAATHIIGDSLITGSDLHAPISGLKLKLSKTESRKLSAAKMQSIDSIVRMGTIIFFPMFAGISLEIMHITSALGGAVVQNTVLFSAILMFYIAYVNNSIVKHSSGYGTDGVMPVVSLSMMQIAIALLAFRLSSVAGSVLLRW